MNMSKRESVLVIIVLILAVLCVYYIFFLKPYMDDMVSVTQAINDKEEQLNSSDKNEQTLAALEDKIAQLDEEIAEYNQEISQSFDQPPILVYLEKTVNKHAEKVMFSFDPVEQYGEIQVCPVRVTMMGTYDGLKNALNELAEGEYFVKVTSLNALYSTGSDPVEQEVFDPATVEIEPASEEEPTPAVPEELLDITLSLEFYSMSEDISPDTVYSFDDGSLDYGGDIFY